MCSVVGRPVVTQVIAKGCWFSGCRVGASNLLYSVRGASVKFWAKYKRKIWWLPPHLLANNLVSDVPSFLTERMHAYPCLHVTGTQCLLNAWVSDGLMNTHICCIKQWVFRRGGRWILGSGGIMAYVWNAGVCQSLAVWSWPHHWSSLSFSVLSGTLVCWALCVMSTTSLVSSCLTVEPEVRINSTKHTESCSLKEGVVQIPRGHIPEEGPEPLPFMYL